MTIYKVQVVQYVREWAEVEVEATSADEARSMALTLAEDGEVDWADGDDSKDLEVVDVSCAP